MICFERKKNNEGKVLVCTYCGEKIEKRQMMEWFSYQEIDKKWYDHYYCVGHLVKDFDDRLTGRKPLKKK